MGRIRNTRSRRRMMIISFSLYIKPKRLPTKPGRRRATNLNINIRIYIGQNEFPRHEEELKAILVYT